jgi:hypothetical protein
MARALVGIDRVLMVTGYTVDKLMQGKTFIDEARKARVSYVVHLGSPGDDDTCVAHYGREQLVERYLEWSGIGFTLYAKPLRLRKHQPGRFYPFIGLGRRSPKCLRSLQ